MADQRYLVGMTQGARKRAVRRDATPAWPGDDTTTYAIERARYRIGERLRLCPLLIHRNGEWIGCFCCESRIRRPLPPSGVVILGNLCDGTGVVTKRNQSTLENENKEAPCEAV